MKLSNKNKQIPSFSKRQQGATLFTTLVFMVLMTVVGVSASKVSLQDMYMANNEQQRMLLFQKTEIRLDEFTQTQSLVQTFSSDGSFQANVSGKEQFRFTNTALQSEGVTQFINNLPVLYPCESQGRGTSLGNGAPAECDLYDFQISSSAVNTSASDKHHRGAGKMVPKSGSKGSIL
jgi:hypothetical protein